MSTTAKKAGSRSGSKKKAPKEQKPKKGKNQRYEYVELGKASLTQEQDHHFYGVVIDASFPYRVVSQKYKYICSLKIVDPSLHVKNVKGTGDGGDYASLIIYSQKFENLPIVQKVGDIIRVNLAHLKLHNHQRQFNAYCFPAPHKYSSWALFSLDGNDNKPYAHPFKSTAFEKYDGPVLQNIRKWAHQYVQNYNVITNDMYVPLNKAGSSKGDFDVVAKILNVHELDEYTNELKIKDASGQVFFTLALKLKFPNLHNGDIVRIRGATVDETSTQKKVLNLSHFSNILTFPSTSKLGKELKSKITDEKAVDKAALKAKVQFNPLNLTEIDKKHQNLQNTPLNELFHQADNDPELAKETTFKTTFSVIKVEPGDVKEWTKAYDKKSKKATSLKGTAATKTAGNIIYQVQFLVKDASTSLNNNTYRILLYTHEGLGANFFNGLQADNLHKNEAARKKLEEYNELLTKFNSWVEAVVERRNGFYFIKDTKLIY